MRGFGKLTYFAFSGKTPFLFQTFIDFDLTDVRDKAAAIRQNKAFLEKSKLHESVKEGMTLFECIDVELAANIAHLNGRTNKKVLSKEEQKTWKLPYESTARTCVRMGWLCNFICYFIHELINSPQKEFSPIC